MSGAGAAGNPSTGGNGNNSGAEPTAGAAGQAGSVAMPAAGAPGGSQMMMMPPAMMGVAGSAGSGMPPSTMQPPIEQVPSTPSSGCGAADHPASGNFMIDVSGMAREYIVKIPADYDANKPYKLVFAWHGLGGSAMQVASGFGGGYYGLESRAMGSTIFVAGQGLQTMNSVGSGAGWANTGGQDVAFVKALVEWLRAKYCIDNERIFSVGMSYGGIMSNTLGCAMGDVFRAIAPMSGSGPRVRGFGGCTCVGQVAVWLSHGNMDTVVPFDSSSMGGFGGGVQSRDYWKMANHCQDATDMVGPGTCVAYQGCDAGNPVHWCEFDGGHTIPSFASEAIWKFFSMF
jgi:poly(3-hydroxybutyrate) depolymerase